RKLARGERKPKDSALRDAEGPVVPRGNRERDNALHDVCEVDAHRLRLRLLLVLLLLFSLLLPFVRRLNFVAERGKGRWEIRAQRDRVEPSRFVHRVRQLARAERRGHVAIGEEKKVLALRVEDRVEAAKGVGSYLGNGLRLQRMHEDRR